MLFDSIPAIYLAAAAIIVGFIGLVWSADRFVAGAAALALNSGLTPMVIGLTVVSFGTSAPEILVSINASLAGAGDIAIGNALGSNLANIGLVLALTALVANIPVQSHILKDELPVLLIITAVAGFLLSDAHLGRVEGWILLFLLLPSMAYMIWAKQKDLSPQERELEEDIPQMRTTMAVLWFLVGLALLILSSKILVWGAQTTATHFGVSPLIIGLTVLAIGTSLPELAASLVSAIKGHHDIALGNIIGSNIFNLLAVMSIPGILHPLTYEREVFTRDYASMAALTVVLALAVGAALLLRRSNARIGKPTGAILLGCYGFYIYLLYLATTQG